MELPKLSTGQIIGGAVALGGLTALGVTAAVIHHKNKKKKRKTSRNKNRKVTSHRKTKRKLKFGSPAYRKKYLKHGRRKTKRHVRVTKRTSHKRIRYTKNKQPYIILPNGRARFIKKRSASSSRKRKGGKY